MITSQHSHFKESDITFISEPMDKRGGTFNLVAKLADKWQANQMESA